MKNNAFDKIVLIYKHTEKLKIFVNVTTNIVKKLYN